MPVTCSKGIWRAAVLRSLVATAVAAGAASAPLLIASGQTAATPSSSLRPAALDRLTRFRDRLDLGPQALERLALDGDDEAKRALTALATERRGPAATAALLRLGDKSQVAVAKQFLADQTLNDPVQLFAALEQIKAAEAAPALVPWLTAPEDEIASRAALTIGRLGYQPAAEELRKMMAETNPLLRPAAAAALWRLGQRDVQPALEDFLTNFLAEVRLAAAAAWAPETDGTWRAVVTPLLQDPNPTRRIAAARLLTSMDPGAVRRAMGQDMRALDDPQLRSEAAAVFEDVATPADSSTLAEALEDSDAAVQVYAAGALLRVTRKAGSEKP